jgi:hypothetical protein
LLSSLLNALLLRRAAPGREALVYQARELKIRLLQTPLFTFTGMKYTYAKYLVLFSLTLALGSCGKDKTTTPDIDFGGYTGRDTQGKLTSPFDPTDWTTDATWNSSETDLFAKHNLSFSQPLVPTSVWKVYTRGNPVPVGGTTDFVMEVDKTNPALPVTPNEWIMSFVLVDARYNVVDWAETNGVNKNFAGRIAYPAAKYNTDTLYRLYYVIFNKDTKTVYYKGHGDIKVIP